MLASSFAKRHRICMTQLFYGRIMRGMTTRVASKTNVTTQGALYNESWFSAANLKVYEVTYPVLDKALDSVTKLEGNILYFQDLGCSAGRNAVDYGRILMQMLRAKGDIRPVRYVFSDLPSNDFPSLMKLLSSAPHLQPDKNVFPFAQAQDFYDPCSPKSSVHLSLSLITMHWISQIPTATVDEEDLQLQPYLCANEPGCPSMIRSLWQKHAHQDLKLFLRLRAQELMPGGAPHHQIFSLENYFKNCFKLARLEVKSSSETGS